MYNEQDYRLQKAFVLCPYSAYVSVLKQRWAVQTALRLLNRQLPTRRSSALMTVCNILKLQFKNSFLYINQILIESTYRINSLTKLCSFLPHQVV